MSIRKSLRVFLIGQVERGSFINRSGPVFFRLHLFFIFISFKRTRFILYLMFKNILLRHPDYDGDKMMFLAHAPPPYYPQII